MAPAWAPTGGWGSRKPLDPDHAPEAFETIWIRLKKITQTELVFVLLVPLLQLLELWVPGERGHGGTQEVHGAGRARKRKEGARSKSQAESAAAFMAQAPGPRLRPASAPPRPASVLRVR